MYESQDPGEIPAVEKSSSDPLENIIRRALNRPLSRRDLLTKSAIAGVLTYLVSVKHSLPWTELLRNTYRAGDWQNFEQERKIVYSKRQIFTGEGDELLIPAKHAYVIVHAGYTEYEGIIQRKELTQYKNGINGDEYRQAIADEWQMYLQNIDDGFYGNYINYLSNISRLIRHLNKNNELAIYALEEKDFYHPIIPRPELLPGSNAKLIVTENHTAFYVKTVQTKEGEVPQNIEAMFRLLRQAGVQEIRLTGELSFNDSNLACLGGVADGFRKKGFIIKGIQGAIFPTKELNPEIDQDMFTRLYTNPIPLSSAIRP